MLFAGHSQNNEYAIKYIAACACCMRVLAIFYSKNGIKTAILAAQRIQVRLEPGFSWLTAAAS
jgi:hypothetical protein